jgi:hypothetical protein
MNGGARARDRGQVAASAQELRHCRQGRARPNETKTDQRSGRNREDTSGGQRAHGCFGSSVATAGCSHADGFVISADALGSSHAV